MKTNFSINTRKILRIQVVLSLLACLLVFSSGCQPAQIPTIQSSITPLPMYPSTSISTAASPAPTTTISPTPFDTPTPALTPTLAIFPLPRAIPAAAFRHPMIENVEAKQLNGEAWTSYIPQEDWQKDFQQTGEYPVISSIVEASVGTLWFATTGSGSTSGIGVYRFDGKTWTYFKMENGLPFDEITAMAVAPDGAVWFGAIGSVSRFDGKTWTAYTTKNGLANDVIRAMAFTEDGALWLGTAEQGVAHFDGKGWQYYVLQDSLQGNYVTPIFVLPDQNSFIQFQHW